LIIFAAMEIQELKDSHSEKSAANVDNSSILRVGLYYLARLSIIH
jgi:hypothetical protein